MKPLLLAAACVDIAVEHSEDASVIYRQIIDAWDRPGCQALLKDNIALPIAEIKVWEQAVTGNNEYESEFDVWTRLYERYRKSDDFQYLFDRISDFIRVGLNRKKDLAQGEPKVIASRAICLCFAVGIWTAGSYLEKRTDWDGETQLKIGDKILDTSALDGVFSERLHRLHSKIFKRYGYRLSQDEKLRNMAWYWYQCRVVYSGPDEFCRKYLLETGIELDPANISKEILLCDIANGYPRKNLTDQNVS